MTADDAMRAGLAWLEQVGQDAELPPLAFKVAFAFSQTPEQSGVRRVDLATLANGAGASRAEVAQSLAQLVVHGHLAAAGRKPGCFRVIVDDGSSRRKGGTEARSPLVPFPLAQRNHKAGNASDVAVRDAGILLSFCLQHGCSPETIARALSRNTDGTASGVIGAALDKITARRQP